MINLRYHIVSLVAVFLALTVGVIAGTTAIDQNVVQALEAQSNSLRGARDAARAQSEQLTRELDVWERFGTQIAPARLEAALEGSRVLLVTTGGVEPTLAQSIEEIVVRAEGSLVGRVSLTSRWASTEADDVEALAGAVRSETAGVAEAAAVLGKRLGRSATPDTDVLARLSEEGFITLDGQLDRPFPRRRTIVIWLAAPGDDAIRTPDGFTLPFLRELSSATSVLVAEPLGTEPSVVDRVRGDADLRQVVATVDHVDSGPGSFALVGALKALEAGKGPQHLGIRGSATAVAPE